MRTEFTRKTKAAAFVRSGGNCELCGARLQQGRFTYDHITPDFMGGDNSLENCQVIGWCCDKPKTANDQRIIAKTKRIIDRRTGALKSRSPFRGWRKFNGDVVFAKKR